MGRPPPLTSVLDVSGAISDAARPASGWTVRHPRHRRARMPLECVSAFLAGNEPENVGEARSEALRALVGRVCQPSLSMSSVATRNERIQSVPLMEIEEARRMAGPECGCTRLSLLLSRYIPVYRWLDVDLAGPPQNRLRRPVGRASSLQSRVFMPSSWI